MMLAEPLRFWLRSAQEMKPDQLSDGPQAPIGQMLSVYRHHLGNSVSALQITLQVLMENLAHWDDIKIRTYLARLDIIAKEQGHLLGALKAYDLESGTPEPIPADQIWGQLTTMAREATEGQALALSLGTPPPKVWVWANLLALESIWRHLIGNACEAMAGKIDPVLAIETVNDGASIVFTFVDNGMGLNREYLTKAPLPLFTTRKGKNGMGLAVVTKLVRELTGQFEMDSVADQGTQVRVRLRIVSGHSSGESH
jgi:C4-dicarboxylate-specific signal transduction histidine kinase